MEDKDLASRFDGLFSDITSEAEAGETGKSLLEAVVADLLEGTSPAGPVAVETVTAEPETIEPLIAEPVAVEAATAEATVAELVAPLAGEPITPAPAVAMPPAEAVPAAAPAPAQPAAVPPAVPQPEMAEAAILEVTQPPAFDWNAQIRARRSRTLNVIFGVVSVLGAVVIGALVAAATRNPSLVKAYAPYFVAYALVLSLSLAWRLDPAYRAIGLVVLAYLVGVFDLRVTGPLSQGGLYLMIVPLLLSVMVGQRAAIVATISTVLTYAAFMVAYRLGLQPLATTSLDRWGNVLDLSGTFAMLAAGATALQWVFHSTLAGALQQVEKQRAETVGSQILLKQQADQLSTTNALLQRRALQLQITAQVASVAALSAQDPDELMQQVVNVIREQMGLHHVGLFLTDEAGEWAALRAGTGEAGQQMLAHNYRIAVDPHSAVGRCITNAQADIAADPEPVMLVDALAQDATVYLLPDMHSEVALPLRSRGKMIGALDLRDTRPDVFSEDDVRVLQTMADQIAVAIDNARLFARAQASLRELEEIQRRYMRERWSEFVSTRPILVYERTRPGVMPLGDAAPPEVEQAMTQREIIVQPNTGTGTEHAALVAPITLHGGVIGVLGLHDTQDGRQWTADEIALVETIADQMSLAIENARLLEETQQRAERERLIAEITTRVRASMDMEGIMRAAVRELGAALGADRAFIRLGTHIQSSER